MQKPAHVQREGGSAAAAGDSGERGDDVFRERQDERGLRQAGAEGGCPGSETNHPTLQRWFNSIRSGNVFLFIDWSKYGPFTV